jgi:probable O-glycosylation ligase (exosortase A-associated)
MNGLIFTLVLTYGGAVVSIFRPFHGLLIYICFAILKPPALWPWAVPPGNYSRIIGVAFLLGWAINGFGDARLGRARAVVWALLGYFFWVILSTTFAIAPERGQPFVEFMAKVVLPFVAGVTLIHSWEQLKALIWVIVGSSAFLAYEANLLYLNGYNLEQDPVFALDNNSLSILMDTSFGLALVLAFEDAVKWRRYLMFGCAAAMAHVPMMSFSRGGMLGAMIAAAVAVTLVPKTRRTWFGIGAALVVASVLAGPSVVDEFRTTFNEQENRDTSAQSRLDLWRDCVDATLKNPILGVGQECWGLIAPTYGHVAGKEAHSLWFQTAAELGIPGVTFLFMFYFLTVYSTWKATRETDAPWMPLLFRMMAASIIGFSVSAAFVTVEGFELPFYVALIGACGRKIAYDLQAAGAFEIDDEDEEFPELEGMPHPWTGVWRGAH